MAKKYDVVAVTGKYTGNDGQEIGVAVGEFPAGLPIQHSEHGKPGQDAQPVVPAIIFAAAVIANGRADGQGRRQGKDQEGRDDQQQALQPVGFGILLTDGKETIHGYSRYFLTNRSTSSRFLGSIALGSVVRALPRAFSQSQHD